LLSSAVLVGEGVEFVDQPFGMDPAGVRRRPGKENGDDLNPFEAI
jgi:hypothetical protein